MAVEYYTPGVYVEEVSSSSKPMTSSPTNIVGFLGETRKGVLNKPILITSWEKYFEQFIGTKIVDKMTPRGTVEKDIDGNPVKEEIPYDKTTNLDWGVYSFFANGGTKCYIVSVNHIDGNNNNSEKIKALNTELKKAQGEAETAKDKGAAAKKVADLEKEIENLSKAPKSTIFKELIGNDGGPDNRKGIPCFKDSPDIAIIAAPGITEPTVVNEIIAYAEAANIFAIIDAPESLNDLKKFGLNSDLDGLAGLSAKCASKQSALYFPWLVMSDPANDTNINVAPSGAVAGIYARVDNARGVYKAPANERVRIATGLVYNLSDSEQESLNVNGVNVIRNFSDIGITVWGARTTVSLIDPEWRYINVRRLFNMVEKTVEKSTKWAVFEPNTPELWTSLATNTTAFLMRLHNAGFFAGDGPAQSFFVRCDGSTNPQENIDAGIVTIEVGIAPVKPAEFIVFRISQKSTAA